MFRPFSIRPSSGLARGTTEEKNNNKIIIINNKDVSGSIPGTSFWHLWCASRSYSSMSTNTSVHPVGFNPRTLRAHLLSRSQRYKTSQLTASSNNRLQQNETEPEFLFDVSDLL